MTRTRQFWMLQTGAWLGYGLENVIAGLGMDRTVSYYQFAFYDAACGFVFTLVIREGVRRSWDWPLRSRLWLGASLLVSTSLVYAFLWAAGISEICIECKPPPYAIGYVSFFAGALCLMLAWTGGYVGVKLALQLQQEKEAALRATAMAHQAQLRMLRYQLNPHFLFNTLNAISTLVLENRREQANGMVGALSGFLRHSLDSDPEQKVTLEQEIGAIRRYLAIEQLQFGERLRLDIDVHPGGSGFPALARARRAGLVGGWACLVRTPSGGLHLYYPASGEHGQESWSLPALHVHFRGVGGYVIAPPSRVVTARGRIEAGTIGRNSSRACRGDALAQRGERRGRPRVARILHDMRSDGRRSGADVEMIEHDRAQAVRGQRIDDRGRRVSERREPFAVPCAECTPAQRGFDEPPLAVRETESVDPFDIRIRRPKRIAIGFDIVERRRAEHAFAVECAQETRDRERRKPGVGPDEDQRLARERASRERQHVERIVACRRFDVRDIRRRRWTEPDERHRAVDSRDGAGRRRLRSEQADAERPLWSVSHGCGPSATDAAICAAANRPRREGARDRGTRGGRAHGSSGFTGARIIADPAKRACGETLPATVRRGDFFRFL